MSKPDVTPCPCPDLECTGVLVHASAAERWMCWADGKPGCGFIVDYRDDAGRAQRCSMCGGPGVLDPDRRGVSVGGLSLRGAFVCSHCGEATIVKGYSKPDDGAIGPWRLADSGRSVDAGGVRIRATADRSMDRDAIELIMGRIARVPDLEAALRQIAEVSEVGDPGAVLADVIQLARDAVAGEQPDDEQETE